MKKQLLLSFITTVILIHSAFGQVSADLQGILKNVDPHAIKGNMTFLSDDLLEGRFPGTRGFELASKYMESQFISLGLEPGLGDSAYVQRVPLRKGWVEGSESSFVLLDKNKKPEKLTYGKEYLLQPYFAAAHSAVTAQLVFVGFGVSAPEFNYDNYKKIDVKGKIVVYMSGAPKTIPTSERAYYSTADAKYSEAIKRGAVAVITLPAAQTVNTPAWEAAVLRSKNGSYKWVQTGGVPANSYGALKAAASFNSQYVDKLFANAPATAQQVYARAAEGILESFALNISASIEVKTATKNVEGSNLVGVIRGSDPKLKNEYIVYSAHLDHLGIGTPVKGDSIYNGAHDDASGNAILLEVARAYRSLKVAPKRSVVFAVVTGEEMGLLGSDFFINNMPFKNGKVVANLAIDMPFFFHPVLDIVPYGADHSSLGQQTQKAAKDLGLKISPDPFPEQVVFIRSDHYSFIKKGIPALFIKSGFMTVSADTVVRSKSDVAWRSTHYHKPQDNMDQAFDFDAAAMHVKINFLIGYYVSNGTDVPAWNKDDFFGRKFLRKENQ